MKYFWRVFSLFVVLMRLSCFSVLAATQEWSAEDKETWKKAVKRVVTTPPCCGACSVLSMSDGRKAYKQVTGDEKTVEGEKIYTEHEKKLLEAFHYFNPARFDYWFGEKIKGEKK